MDTPVLMAIAGGLLILFSGANPVTGGIGVILLGFGALLSFTGRDD
jgi:hypothetical protein